MLTRSVVLCAEHVIQLFVFSRGSFPAEVGVHAALDHLVPVLFILEGFFSFTYLVHHLMRIVILEGEAGAGILLGIVLLNGILQTAGLAHDGNRIWLRPQGSKSEGIRKVSHAA